MNAHYSVAQPHVASSDAWESSGGWRGQKKSETWEQSEQKIPGDTEKMICLHIT